MMSVGSSMNAQLKVQTAYSNALRMNNPRWPTRAAITPATSNPGTSMRAATPEDRPTSEGCPPRSTIRRLRNVTPARTST